MPSFGNMLKSYVPGLFAPLVRAEQQGSRQLELPALWAFRTFLRCKFHREPACSIPSCPKRVWPCCMPPRGIGKSWLGLSIGLPVAAGSSLVRWKAPEPRRVLLVDGEMPLSDLQVRLALISIGLGAHIPPGFDYYLRSRCHHLSNASRIKRYVAVYSESAYARRESHSELHKSFLHRSRLAQSIAARSPIHPQGRHRPIFCNLCLSTWSCSGRECWVRSSSGATSLFEPYVFALQYVAATSICFTGQVAQTKLPRFPAAFLQRRLHTIFRTRQPITERRSARFRRMTWMEPIARYRPRGHLHQLDAAGRASEYRSARKGRHGKHASQKLAFRSCVRVHKVG